MCLCIHLCAFLHLITKSDMYFPHQLARVLSVFWLFANLYAEVEIWRSHPSDYWSVSVHYSFRTTEILALGDLKESCCSKWILKIVCGGVRKMSTKTIQIISKEYYYFYGLDKYIETILLYKYNYSTNYPYISNYKNLI